MTTVIITITVFFLAVIAAALEASNHNDAEAAIHWVSSDCAINDEFNYSVEAVNAFEESEEDSFDLATASEEEILEKIRPQGEIQNWVFSHGLDYADKLNYGCFSGYEDFDSFVDNLIETGKVSYDMSEEEFNTIVSEEADRYAVEELEKDYASMIERISHITDISNATICVTLKKEELGGFGVYVKGDITLAAKTDIFSFKTSDGNRSCVWNKWWDEIVIGHEASNLTPYLNTLEEDKYHELWAKNFQIVGIWVKDFVPETFQEYLKQFANDHNISFEIIENKTVDSYCDATV